MRRQEPRTEAGAILFLHTPRHAYGAYVQQAGESSGFRYEQAGLGGLEAHSDMSAYSIRAWAARAGVEAGRDIHRKDEIRSKAVELCHEASLAFPQ